MVNAAPEAPTTEIPDGLLARHGAAMARHAKAVALVSVLLAIGAYLLATLGVGGQSLLAINLRRLARYGVREVVVNVHHFADLVID